MILDIDVWLLPAVAAGSSSYLVSLAWERFRPRSAPPPATEGLLAALSFCMGGASAYYRDSEFQTTPENNVIVMFLVGATTTFLWLFVRRYLEASRNGDA